MQTSETIADLSAALAKAQQALKPAVKDAKNPHFNSSYADLASVLAAAKVYAEAGISIVQDVQLTDAGVSVTTRLLHTSGQWLETGPLTVPVGKRDAHGVGSATTYGKRYALQAALLIPSDDDDGNGAVSGAKQPTGEDTARYANWLLDLEAVAKESTYADLIGTIKGGTEADRKRLAASDDWPRLKAMVTTGQV